MGCCKLAARSFAFTSIDPCSFSVAFASPGSRPFEVAQTDVQDVAMLEVVPYLVVKLVSSCPGLQAVLKAHAPQAPLKLVEVHGHFPALLAPVFNVSSSQPQDGIQVVVSTSS
jgi:hypothetical protein